jgi:hypothetical protein
MRLGCQIDHLTNRHLGNLSVFGAELGVACYPRPTVNDANPVFSNAIVFLTTLAGMGAILALFFLLK